jgi:hypothetical protein
MKNNQEKNTAKKAVWGIRREEMRQKNRKDKTAWRTFLAPY